MRPRWGLGAGAALLALLLVAPPGSSLAGSGTVTAAMPVQLWGPLDAQVAHGGLAARGGAFDGTLVLERGRVELTTLELVLGPLGGLRRTTQVLAGPGAVLEIAPAASGQLVALGAASVRTLGEGRLAVPVGEAFLVEQGREAFAIPYPTKSTLVQVTQGQGAMAGPLHLFLTDAAVRLRRGPAEVLDLDLSPTTLLRLEGVGTDLAGRRVDLDFQAAEAALASAAAKAGAVELLDVQEVVVKRVLEVTGDGALAVRSQGAELQAFGRSPLVHVLGAAAFRGALGEIALPGTSVSLRGDQAQAAGDFWLRALPAEGDERKVHVNGAFTAFAVNGRVVELQPEAAGAVALGALAFLGLASPFLGKVLAPFYARIGPSEALGSEVRRRLYELVQREPGLSLSELSQRQALSWGNTVHHLAVLKRSGLVVSLRHGRYRRWFAAGAVELERRGQVAALRNPTSASLARHILAEPGLSQKHLADRLGMSPQAVHWHLVRLTQAGLLERVRDGREVRHYVRAAPPLPAAVALAPAAPSASEAAGPVTSAAAPAAPRPRPQ